MICDSSIPIQKKKLKISLVHHLVYLPPLQEQGYLNNSLLKLMPMDNLYYKCDR